MTTSAECRFFGLPSLTSSAPIRVSAAATIYGGSGLYRPENQEPLYTGADGESLALSASLQASVFPFYRSLPSHAKQNISGQDTL